MFYHLDVLLDDGLEEGHKVQQLCVLQIICTNEPRVCKCVRGQDEPAKLKWIQTPRATRDQPQDVNRSPRRNASVPERGSAHKKLPTKANQSQGFLPCHGLMPMPLSGWCE